MNKIQYFFILLLVQFHSNAQQNTILLSEFSITQPIGAFSENNIGAQQGFGGGLHLDKLNIYKGFGLGIYAGYTQNSTQFGTNFPNEINNAGIRSRIFVDDNNKLNWSSYQLAIGPLLNFNLSKQLQLQFYSKAGLAKVDYPEYRYYANVTEPVEQEYTLFEANTPKEDQSNFNFMMLSGFRFNFNFSRTIGLSLGANYTHIKGLTHTYTTKDLNISGAEEPSILFEALQNAEEQTKTFECNINTINATVGIVINLGGGTKPPKEEVSEEPDIPIETNAPEESYNCESVIYEGPGYNDYVVLDKTPFAIFEWLDENPRAFKEDKGYQLLFYIKENGEYKEVDKRIMKSKRRFKVGLNPKKAYPDNALYWKIIPVDKENTAFCPEPSKMMRLLVFKDQNEALARLPQCLNINEDISPRTNRTDAFRKNKKND